MNKTAGRNSQLYFSTLNLSLSLSLSLSLKMATIFSTSSNITLHNSQPQSVPFQPNLRQRLIRVRCSGQNPKTNSSTGREPEEPTNAVLKLAWYGSELLGIATSFFRRAEAPDEVRGDLARDGSGVVDRAILVRTIKDDFQRSYFVTGNLTLDAYEEDCEFADPASSFKGLRRFKRNCTNFGSLIEKSNMKLMKWEDFEDKGIGHWRFSCILSFPWRPILSASGYTEYFFDAQSGKVCRHVEHWNVPKMVLLKQILRPSRGLKTGG